ncbi:allergin-1 [Myotis lucifugus]|uniref:allergin-1 n=1 Tax=Myotis lucifugus TaxID=59463 RepID=UPI0003C471AA|nr:allergin-1 [Myotis lucifugus]
MMWKKSIFVFLFSLLTLKAELDCETMKKNTEFISPRLQSKTNIVRKGQKVSLNCSHQNKSLQITYSLFRDKDYMGTQDSKGKPVIFNLSISEARDSGPYQCKANISNCQTYSHKFNFTIVDPVTTPVLKIVQNQTNLYITLHCISFNGSLPINYTFFEKGIALSPVISKHVREPAEFNLTKSNTGEGKEYHCEAKNSLPDNARYSDPVTMPSTSGDSCPLCLPLLLPLLLLMLIIILLLAFWIRQKYKARKAMRDKAPRDYGNTPIEVGIYANVHENQADEPVPGLEPRQCVSTAQDETEHSHEIHYATPMFLEVIPEAHNDNKSGCVYAELSL